MFRSLDVNRRIKMKGKMAFDYRWKHYMPEYQSFNRFKNTALFPFN